MNTIRIIELATESSRRRATIPFLDPRSEI